MKNKELYSLLELGVQDINEKSVGELTSIQRRIKDLLRVKLENFTIDDLRFMIIQEVGIQYLLDKALVILKENILAEGIYYEGDLLKSILLISKDFWINHTDKYSSVCLLLKENEEIFNQLDLSFKINCEILQNIKLFLI